MSGGASISVPTIPVAASLPSVSAGSTASGGFNELRGSNVSRRARVLYDYDAASSSELSLLADEVNVPPSFSKKKKKPADFTSTHICRCR